MRRKPITVWVERPDIDVSTPDMDGKRTPEQIRPNVGPVLQPLIAGCTRIHKNLWAVQFAWPLTNDVQRSIRRRLVAQNRDGKAVYFGRAKVPEREVEVTEQEPDLDAKMIDGVRPKKDVKRRLALRTLSHRSRFVTE
ncbi:MAG: hypothetical protein GY851_03375 [bacterium]|nr:hypothetical protein [bacterium]